MSSIDPKSGLQSRRLNSNVKAFVQACIKALTTTAAAHQPASSLQMTSCACRVHVDYTLKSGPGRLHEVLPEEAAELQKTPFAVIQVPLLLQHTQSAFLELSHHVHAASATLRAPVLCTPCLALAKVACCVPLL